MTIPFNIFQTWKTKNLPIELYQCVLHVKKKNPDFKYYLYDDKQCASFLSKYFDPLVVETYHLLKPGAFKADLWRYCVLYIFGGVYLDIKFIPTISFRDYIDRECWTRSCRYKNAIYQGFIISPPKTLHLEQSIRKIVWNTYHHFYGKSGLEPTGPELVIQFVSSKLIDSSPFYFDRNSRTIKCRTSNKIICYSALNYNKYRLTNNSYGELWKNRDVYLTPSVNNSNNITVDHNLQQLESIESVDKHNIPHSNLELVEIFGKNNEYHVYQKITQYHKKWKHQDKQLKKKWIKTHHYLLCRGKQYSRLYRNRSDLSKDTKMITGDRLLNFNILCKR